MDIEVSEDYYKEVSPMYNDFLVIGSQQVPITGEQRPNTISQRGGGQVNYENTNDAVQRDLFTLFEGIVEPAITNHVHEARSSTLTASVVLNTGASMVSGIDSSSKDTISDYLPVGNPNQCAALLPQVSVCEGQRVAI